jgi:gas vesicle protein
MLSKFYGFILTIAGIVASLFFAFTQGKKAKENEENKKVAKDVEEINKRKFDISKLSNVELKQRLQKFKRPSK